MANAYALVYLDESLVGTTPLTIRVDEGAGSVVRLELAGFRACEFKLPSTPEATVFLNVVWGLAGRPIATMVDNKASQGAAPKSQYTIELEPIAKR